MGVNSSTFPNKSTEEVINKNRHTEDSNGYDGGHKKEISSLPASFCWRLSL